jgi:hypothetical protein
LSKSSLKWGVEFEFALIHQLHYGVGENRLGHRRSVHDSVGSQRITLGVADSVGMDVSDFAVIDDRNRHTLGMGAGHHLAHFGVDDGAAGYRLCDRCDGAAQDSKKKS